MQTEYNILFIICFLWYGAWYYIFHKLQKMENMVKKKDIEDYVNLKV